jgi:predicted RNA-binding Zn-ribbon protein involved in translation (DUF1610 family)
MGKHEQEIIEIVEEPYILTFSYKYLGDKHVKAYSLIDFKGNKKKLVEKLHEVLEDCDVGVAHNGNSFDFRWANRAFIQFGLKPVKPFKTVDTLLIARNKFNFSSNHLDDLGEFLGVGRKMKHEGFSLWKKVMALDRKATNQMVDYNKKDVELLERIYNKLTPFATNIPQLRPSDISCPLCGSDHVQRRGFFVSRTSMSQRYQCQDCGKWSLSSKKIKYQDGEYTK